jgi:hypothetical protein
MKLDRISSTFAIVVPTSGIAQNGFTRLWNTVCLAIEAQEAVKVANPYVAGAPAATGYIEIKDSNGVTYKVLVAA